MSAALQDHVAIDICYFHARLPHTTHRSAAEGWLLGYKPYVNDPAGHYEPVELVSIAPPQLTDELGDQLIARIRTQSGQDLILVRPHDRETEHKPPRIECRHVLPTDELDQFEPAAA